MPGIYCYGHANCSLRLLHRTIVLLPLRPGQELAQVGTILCNFGQCLHAGGEV